MGMGKVFTVFIFTILLTSFSTPAFSAGPLVCLAPDRVDGTVNALSSCPYVNETDPWNIIDGLPAGTTIEMDVLLHDYNNIMYSPGGNLGGEREDSDALLQLTMTGTGTLGGFNRMIFVPVNVQQDTGARILGDPVQNFPNDIFSLQGGIFGDPDFDQIMIRGGTNFGLPSPGATTLTELPGGDFQVDSFFDIFYEIEFQGAPGSVLEGFTGTTEDSSRMVQLGEDMLPGDSIRCLADLSGDQEVIEPPVVTPASGSAVLELNPTQDRLTINIELVQLDLVGATPITVDDDVTGLHIHRAPAGSNGAVVFGMISPNNDLNGDLLINDGIVLSAWDEGEGNGVTLSDEIANLLDENLYINVHTTAFPAGEIRGQIICEQKPVGGTFIPIDTTALLLAGLSTNYSILSVLGIIGSVTFAALYFSTKRKQENS